MAVGRQGRTADGERAHRRALRHSPNDAGIWQNLGNRLAEQDRAGLQPLKLDSTSALHPVVRHLKRAADFARNDPPTVRLDKLEGLLRPSSRNPDLVMR